ncbi:MAG: helix-turn-helix domain-containing protein [Patescibacteria group bacterium]
MKTQTVGSTLQEKRQSRRVTLDVLAEKTMIRRDYLENLEKDEFEKLPAASFVKGFIRAYGRVLGFDPKPLIALLRRDYKESAKGKLVPREFLKPVLKQRQTLNSVTFLVAGLFVVFGVVFSYIGLQWYNLVKPPEIVLSSPTEDEFVSSQVVVEGMTVPDAVVVVNSQPVAINADGTFKTQIHLPREGISTITVEATDRRGKSNFEQRTVYVKF